MRSHEVQRKIFLDDFHETYQFGATEANGVDRQAGTENHGKLRDWFVSKAREYGMEVKVDGIGNVFALTTWNPEADYVFVGSHLDSQPLGGRFDGCYGVIAALHSAAILREKVENGELEPNYNLAVVDWFNEEGARFAPSIMGSSVLAGLMDKEEMLSVTDAKGVSVQEALYSIGYLGTDKAPTPAAYAEIHIEQGRILERNSTSIGAVTQSWYTQKLNVSVVGEQSHTGATVMSDRHDALTAASEIVLAVERVVENFSEDEVVTSVGQFTVLPNSPIVVPRQVDLVIDLRAHTRDQVLFCRNYLLKFIDEVAERRHIRIDAVDFDIRDHQRYPVEGVELTEKAAAEVGVTCQRIETMAGHDSVPLNRIVPTVMTFVPSVGGVSHCEREFTEDADLVNGLDVLVETTSQLLQGAMSK